MSTLLDRFYAALKALSPEDLAACVTDDFVLEWQGTAALPWAGRWQGVQGLLQFVEKLNAEIEILQVERTHLLEGPDVTVVVLRGRWRAKRTQREIAATGQSVHRNRWPGEFIHGAQQYRCLCRGTSRRVMPGYPHTVARLWPQQGPQPLTSMGSRPRQ